jgi:cytochrome P450
MSAAPRALRPAHVPAERVVDFDIYRPPGVETDFHASWQRLQAPGLADIVWTPHNGGHWIAVRGAVIRDIFANHDKFSSRVILVPKAVGELHNMIPTTVDPPLHQRYRTLLNDSLAPRAVGKLEAQIRATASSLIDAVAGEGHCDFTSAYAEIFPLRIFMSLVDLPNGDIPMLKHWADQTVRPDGSMPFEVAKQNICDYLEPYIEARTGGEGVDLISRMINRPIEGRALSREEALNLTSQVMIAGLDTVVNFLGFAFMFMAKNRSHRERLAADRALIPAAVEELLRRFPIVTIAREVKHTLEYHGVRLAQGEMIVVPTPLVGTDERLNERPLEVDFDRPTAQHATFGHGRHMCPGAHLARLELRITIEEWLARIPEFEIAPGAQLRFSGGIVGVVAELPLVWPSAPAPTAAAPASVAGPGAD